MAIYDLTNLSDRDGKEFEEFKTKLLKKGYTNEFTPDEMYNRLYKNKQFADKFGEEYFNKITDPETRDRIFRNSILDEELQRYTNDPNYNLISNMTPEGQLELLQNGYLSPEDKTKEALASDNLTEEQRKMLNSAGWANLGKTTVERAGQGAGLGALIGGVIGAVGGAGVGAIPAGTSGLFIGAGVGAVEGIGESIWDRFVSPENLSEEVQDKNEELLNDTYKKDVERKRESTEVQGTSNEIQSEISNNLENGSMTQEQFDKLFESIVGNKGTDENPIWGSNYYGAFKDNYLADLDESTKIKIVADALAMEQYYPEDAMTGIDGVFQNLVADRQSEWRKWWNSIGQRNIIGFTNSLAQLSTDILGFGIRVAYGDKAAVDFIENGKIGDLDLGYLSGAHWSKAAKYNVWTKDDIAAAEKVGGLSTSSTVDEVDKSRYAWDVMTREAFGQMHYLGYYALMGGAMGRVTKFFKMNPSGLPAQATAVIVPNLSMSAQMGREAYDNTKETLMGKYNEQVQKTLEGLVQTELDKVDWNKELQDYKSRHSREGEQILMSDDKLLEMLKAQKAAEMAQSLLPAAEAANTDVLEKVDEEALDAFRLESCMDLFKNSINSMNFRGYIYNNNRALQNSIRNRELGIRFDNGRAVAPTLNKKKLLFKSVGKEMLGEGLDEYLDGVTTGMAEGFNVANFGDWLSNRENPDSVDGVTQVFNAFAGMSMGIRNSFNSDNLYEAALGALSPIMPLFQRSSVNPITGKRYFFTNAIYEEYISGLHDHKEAVEKVATINSFLDKHKNDIENIAYGTAFNSRVELAKRTGNTKLLKDAEQQQLYQVATLINSVHDLAQGTSVESQIVEKLQQLAEGNYTEEEKEQLGAEFLGQPENKNSGMTRKEAYERMRKNAQEALDAAAKLRETEAKINKHHNAKKLSDKAKDHLKYLAIQGEDWEKRLSSITKELGIGDSHSSTLTVEDMADKDDAFQLMQELSKRVSITNNSIYDINKEIEKEKTKLNDTKNDKKLSRKEKKEKIKEINAKIEGLTQAKDQMFSEKDRLVTLYNQANHAYTNWKDNDRVASADEIMGMSAAKIQYMIEHKSKYSEEQRAQIDEAINRLTKNDPKFLEKLDDAVKIADSIEQGNRAYSAIQNNPKGYDELASRLEEVKNRIHQDKENRRYREGVFIDWDSKSPEEILSDALEREDPSLLEEYISRREKRGDELNGIRDVIELINQLQGLVNENYFNDDGTGETIRRNAVIANAIRENIKEIAKQGKSREEALQFLNDFLKDTSIPINVREDIQDVLDTAKLLDKAAAVTFHQEKEEIARKEEERRKEDERLAAEYDAAQKEAADRWADEEAARKAAESSEGAAPESLTEGENGTGEAPKPQQENGEKAGPSETPEGDKKGAGEPSSKGPDNYSPTESPIPTTDKVVEEQLREAERAGTITDTTEKDLEREIKTGNAQEGEFVGNVYSRYRVIDGVVRLREDYEHIEGKLKAIFDWFDNADIHYQEVIDNELEAISKLNPDVRILRVNSKDNAANDMAMRDVFMLVVEYTDDIAAIHKGSDSIVTADGKKWLVIGALGYNNAVDSQTQKYKRLTDNRGPLRARFNQFFASHPNERFHVDEVAHTRISRINPGRLVRGSAYEEGSVGIRPISELLETSGLSLRNAKWAIADGTGLKVVGRITDGKILNEQGISLKAGTVYLLIPGAGGQYIASYISPSYTDTLKQGSELHSIITDALTRLTSNSYEERRKALEELFQYIYLDGENDQILIGTKDSNVLTIVQGGKSTTYRLGDPNTSNATIINELKKAHFRVQVSTTLLSNRDMIELLDAGGALLTDLNKYGVSGADFTVYEMDEQGTPNIPDEGISIPQASSTPRPTTSGAVLYKGKLYVESPTGWRSFDGTVITDPTEIRHLKYLSEINKGKIPDSTTDTHSQYIFDSNEEHPIVIAVDKRGYVTELSKEEAVEYIRNQREEAAQRAKDAEMQAAMERTHIDEEVVDFTTILDEQQTRGFESILFGDDGGTIDNTTDSDNTDRIDSPPPASRTPKPNSAPLRSGEGLTSVNELLVTQGSRLTGVIMDKINSGEWTDFPMDGSNDELLDYLEKKGVQTVGIQDVEAWFDNLINCIH